MGFILLNVDAFTAMASKVTKKDWKVILEEDLCAKSCLITTYTAWEKNRDQDWKNLLIKSRPELTKSMSNEVTFYDMLQSMNVFNKRTIESIKVGLAHVFLWSYAKSWVWVLKIWHSHWLKGKIQGLSAKWNQHLKTRYLKMWILLCVTAIVA